MIHRLKGMRCYLSGAMQKLPDSGVQWRNKLTEWLHSKDVEVFDPCNKPCDYGDEIESKPWMNSLIKKGDWNAIEESIKLLRFIDLRMVALSDFIIVYLSKDIPTCGTWEELAVAVQQNKPVLIVYEQGKKQAPHWLFGQIPTQMIFSNFEQAKKYLDYIDTAEAVHDSNRWVFFNYDQLRINKKE